MGGGGLARAQYEDHTPSQTEYIWVINNELILLLTPDQIHCFLVSRSRILAIKTKTISAPLGWQWFHCISVKGGVSKSDHNRWDLWAGEAEELLLPLWRGEVKGSTMMQLVLLLTDPPTQSLRLWPLICVTFADSQLVHGIPQLFWFLSKDVWLAGQLPNPNYS